MIAFILLALQSSEGQIAQIARTFGVDWVHLGAQIVSFGIVCALLYKFAYKHVLQMLEERRRQIAQGLENAEKIKAELDRIETQRQEVIAQAHIQAAQFIEEARASAARLLQQETQQAILTAEQITARAREASAQDHERMLGELKREVGRLVVQATTIVTGKILTAEDQRRLAEETAKQVAA
jgi:F-type H+-transporting ATPase subunit b